MAITEDQKRTTARIDLGGDALQALQDMLAAQIAGSALKVVITAVDGEDGTATVTAKVTDQAGNTVAGTFLLRLWIAQTLLGAASDTNVTTYVPASGGGTAAHTYTAKCDYDVLTASTGVAVMTLTGADDTYYAMAQLSGEVYGCECPVTGNV